MNTVSRGMALGLGAYLGILLFRLYSFLCGVLFLALFPALMLHAWGPVLVLGISTLVVWVGGWWLLFGRGR